MITIKQIAHNAVANTFAFLINGRVECYAVHNNITGIESRHRLDLDAAMRKMDDWFNEAEAMEGME